MGELVKTTTVTSVTPASAPVPPVDPIDFWLFAPPTAPCYGYRDTDAGHFNQWAPIQFVPPQQSSQKVVAGYVFVPLEAVPIVNGSYQLPAGATWVYAYGAISGYSIPVYTTVTTGGGWPRVGPLRNMTYFNFDGSCESNGWPIGPASKIYTGYVDIPTATGLQRVVRKFRKVLGPRPFGGVGAPADTDWYMAMVNDPANTPNPPLCRTKAYYGIIALEGLPGRPGIPGKPAVVTRDPHVGWNAGANSIAAIDGDVRSVFQAQVGVAGVVGFTPAGARDDVTRYENLSHAFYFDRDPHTGGPRFACLEQGQQVRAPQAYDPTKDCELRRVGADGVVSFLYDGTEVYRSARGVFGPLRVGTALYRAGDIIP